jgi:hypothetical protein
VKKEALIARINRIKPEMFLKSSKKGFSSLIPYDRNIMITIAQSHFVEIFIVIYA